MAFTKDFDFAYWAEDWEFTASADHLELIDEQAVEDAPRGSIAEISTLVKGPTKYAAKVPVTFDEDGDPDEEEIQWFDTREEAEAALARRPEGATS